MLRLVFVHDATTRLSPRDPKASSRCRQSLQRGHESFRVTRPHFFNRYLPADQLLSAARRACQPSVSLLALRWMAAASGARTVCRDSRVDAPGRQSCDLRHIPDSRWKGRLWVPSRTSWIGWAKPALDHHTRKKANDLPLLLDCKCVAGTSDCAYTGAIHV